MKACRRFLSAFLCLALMTGTSPLLAQERHLHAVPLQRALPEQIAPLLAAQVGPGSTVTPYGNQLILNVTDGEYAQIRELLQQLDSAPRSLSIAVRGLRSGDARVNAGGVRGSWGNDRVQVTTGGGPSQLRGDGEIRVEQRSLRGSDSNDQQVRAVEGMAAYIGSGSLVPMQTGYSTRELVPVERGFYATARVIGDEVVVDIDQRDDGGPVNAGGAIRTAGINTQIRGRLGEWIPLGGVNQRQDRSERGIASYRDEQSAIDSNVAIKVELLDR